MTINAPLNRKLRMALVGGGGNAFIGRVHAISATLDNRAELVAGALSSDPHRSRVAAPDFGIADERAYGSYQELLSAESERDAGERVDFISIATPNYTHFEMARAALEAGFNVVCDKPMTVTIEEAEELARTVSRMGAVFALTHNYSGYPLVKQAREMILGGELGEIHGIRAAYIQGWLRSLEPGVPPARGAWKADPAKAGPSGALADIGTHAFQLARYMTGLEPDELCSTLAAFAPDRELDDYGHTLIRFKQGALGAIAVSQVTHGRLNDLEIEVDGTAGSLSWRQEEPNELIVRRLGEPTRIYERNPNAPFTHEASRRASRLPGGHPEAFFEAFANVYSSAFDDMVRRASGNKVPCDDADYPNVHDGVEGVQFIHRCLASNRDRSSWVTW